MARTASQVAAWAKSHADRRTGGWVGLCLKFSRMAAGAPGGVYDAHTGWARARYRHTKGTPPRGAIVWWHGGKHGHVAVSAGNGYVYSTDVVVHGQVRRCKISLIRQRWGQRYMGWSEDVNGVRIAGLSPKSVGGGGGKVPSKPKPRRKITINGKQYDDISGVSTYYINKNRDGKHFSRHIWYTQRWLNKVMNGKNIPEDGRWGRITQGLFDRFRREKMHLHGNDAKGRVGVRSLGKLNDMAHSAKPVRSGK
jgi:hypothetical protein